MLLLKIGDTVCKLPSGKLKPGESGKISFIIHKCIVSYVREVHVYWAEIDGLKRKLGSTFGGTTPLPAQDWQVIYLLKYINLQKKSKAFMCFFFVLLSHIGECVAVWWRPNFDTVMYPYCPPNITNPKV
jgi:cleavage and polyadenylation specificity factor subunit 5